VEYIVAQHLYFSADKVRHAKIKKVQTGLFDSTYARHSPTDPTHKVPPDTFRVSGGNHHVDGYVDERCGSCGYSMWIASFPHAREACFREERAGLFRSQHAMPRCKHSRFSFRLHTHEQKPPNPSFPRGVKGYQRGPSSPPLMYFATSYFVRCSDSYPMLVQVSRACAQRSTSMG